MTKKILAVLCAVLLMTALCLPVSAAPASKDVLEAREGVVRIFTQVGEDMYTGTGFAVSVDDRGIYLVTNAHVINGADALGVFYNGQGPIAADIVSVSAAQDLAVLYLSSSVQGLRALELSEEQPSVGEQVYTLGYPGGADDLSQNIQLTIDEMTMSEGIISAFQNSNTVGDGSRTVRVLQTSAPINHGNSGGPMLNSDGIVVGVNTLGMGDWGVQNINGAIHVGELTGFLKAVNVPFNEKDSLLGKAVKPALGVVGVLVVLGLVKKRPRRQKYTPMDSPDDLDDLMKTVSPRETVDDDWI